MEVVLDEAHRSVDGETLVNLQPAAAIQVLLVDDDEEFASLLAKFLTAEGGFVVTLRHDGVAGAEAAIHDDYDVIVLDVGLPQVNGFEVLKRVRASVDTPVIMLTARGDDIDRILGFEIGADDYVPKPCNLRELAARIRAITRRTSDRTPNEAAADELSVIGDLKIEASSQTVFRNEKLIALTGAEYRVLERLIESAGEVVDKDSIARHALGRRIMPYDRSVDAHVSNLRKKLGPLSDGRQRIKTVRGRGYLYVTSTLS